MRPNWCYTWKSATPGSCIVDKHSSAKPGKAVSIRQVMKSEIERNSQALFEHDVKVQNVETGAFNADCGEKPFNLPPCHYSSPGEQATLRQRRLILGGVGHVEGLAPVSSVLST